ncbi:MAG: spermidine/putrescine ABC transporter substrate-binding protein, partial [Pirellulaceae bacterium]
AGQRLNVFNWSDYLDPKLIPEFEKRTGARVQYDNFSSESELDTKLLTGGGGYDVVFPSDHSMVVMVEKDLLADLDKSQLPNLAHIDPQFLDPPYDPGCRRGAPYFWGTLAIGIRTDHVKQPVEGFEVLFDERYAGRITMLDDAENVVGAMMMHLGHSINSVDDRELAEVKRLLERQRPLVQAYTSDAYKEKLIKGEAWVVLGWSGDIVQAASESEHVRAIVPQRGTMLWVDSMAIPKAARNKRLAHAFINFLLEPEIAARNAKFVSFPSPNLAAREMLDAEILADPAIYPPEPVLRRCQRLHDRGPAIAKIEKLWREVRQ